MTADLQAPRRDEAGGRRALVAAAVLAVVGMAVAVGLVVDALADAPPPPAPAAARVAQDVASAGAWYCPGVAEEDATAAVSVAAVGEQPSTVTVVRYPNAEPEADEPTELAPGEQLEVTFEPGAATPVAVRWEGGPAAAVWRTDALESAGASCAPAPSDSWHVSGLDTAEGSQSALHLFNPYSVDALARVVLATGDGVVAPALTDSVVVPAGEAVRVDLNEVQPEEADLGATVRTLSGRLVAQGEVASREPEDPEADPDEDEPAELGRALLPAVPAPVTEVAFATARATGDTDSWLVLMNPGDIDAAVEVVASDPQSGSAVLGETTVPAGAVVRLDLAEASEEGSFGLSLRSANDVGVVAARLIAVDGDDGTALSAVAGSEASTEWALVGGSQDGRDDLVSVYNPGGEPVTAAIDAGEATPDSWEEITVGPNTRRRVRLGPVEPSGDGVAVRVTADGLVVTDLIAAPDDGPVPAWTLEGLSPQGWSGPPTRPSVRRDPDVALSLPRAGASAAEADGPGPAADDDSSPEQDDPDPGRDDPDREPDDRDQGEDDADPGPDEAPVDDSPALAGQ